MRLLCKAEARRGTQQQGWEPHEEEAKQSAPQPQLEVPFDHSTMDERLPVDYAPTTRDSCSAALLSSGPWVVVEKIRDSWRKAKILNIQFWVWTDGRTDRWTT